METAKTKTNKRLPPYLRYRPALPIRQRHHMRASGVAFICCPKRPRVPPPRSSSRLLADTVLLPVYTVIVIRRGRRLVAFCRALVDKVVFLLRGPLSPSRLLRPTELSYLQCNSLSVCKGLCFVRLFLPPRFLLMRQDTSIRNDACGPEIARRKTPEERQPTLYHLKDPTTARQKSRRPHIQDRDACTSIGSQRRPICLVKERLFGEIGTSAKGKNHAARAQGEGTCRRPRPLKGLQDNDLMKNANTLAAYIRLSSPSPGAFAVVSVSHGSLLGVLAFCRVFCLLPGTRVR